MTRWGAQTFPTISHRFSSFARATAPASPGESAAARRHHRSATARVVSTRPVSASSSRASARAVALAAVSVALSIVVISRFAEPLC